VDKAYKHLCGSIQFEVRLNERIAVQPDGSMTSEQFPWVALRDLKYPVHTDLKEINVKLSYTWYFYVVNVQGQVIQKGEVKMRPDQSKLRLSTGGLISRVKTQYPAAQYHPLGKVCIISGSHFLEMCPDAKSFTITPFMTVVVGPRNMESVSVAWATEGELIHPMRTRSNEILINLSYFWHVHVVDVKGKSIVKGKIKMRPDQLRLQLSTEVLIAMVKKQYPAVSNMPVGEVCFIQGPHSSEMCPDDFIITPFMTVLLRPAKKSGMKSLMD
jgi:hypothetical protein